MADSLTTYTIRDRAGNTYTTALENDGSIARSLRRTFSEQSERPTLIPIMPGDDPSFTHVLYIHGKDIISLSWDPQSA